MGRSLVIVESPAKAKTINKYLGRDFIVKSSYGHIRDLPGSAGEDAKAEDPATGKGAGAKAKAAPASKEQRQQAALVRRMGVDPERGWAARYEVLPGKAKVVAELREAAAKVDAVYLASDLDREGESIAWHLMEVIGGDPARFKRVTFSEITKPAIQAAFANPGAVNLHRVHAQQARRFLDRVVGFMVSPLLWQKIARGLSAGRVQSVAVRLIVEREREIRAFRPEEYWQLFADLAKGGEAIRAQVVRWRGAKFEPRSRAEAEAAVVALRGAAFAVAEREDKPQRSWPSPPFITSTLQAAASVRLGFSVKKTMTLAQRLYEAGHITYMRTDSTNLSGEAVQSCRALLEQRFGARYLPEKPVSYKSKEGAQEAHEAIRPTDVARAAAELGVEADEARLYDLIWRQFVACQMPPAEFDTTAVAIRAGEHELAARGRVLRFDGFMKVQPPAKQEDVILPALAVGDRLALAKLDPTQHFTKPPARFSEAMLVRELEKRGIGRPSTYASIISTIQERGYVSLKNRRFYAEKLGDIVTGRLVEAFPDLLDYGFTAGMEEDLDEIADAKAEWKGVLDEFYRGFTAKLAQAGAAMRPNAPVPTPIACPTCGKHAMAIRTAKTGVFLSCQGYSLAKKDPAFCAHTMNLVPGEEAVAVKAEDEESEAASEVETAALASKRRCPVCSTAMDAWLVDEHRKLHICGRSPDCAGVEVEAGQFKLKGYEGPSIPCDKCGKPMQLKLGRFGKYFGCTGWPDCANTRKLLRSGEAAPPKEKPVPMPELACAKGGHFVLRDGAAGLFLASSAYPKVRETRAPRVKELAAHREALAEKYRYLADGPAADPNGNDVFVRFSRKTRQHFLASEKDGEATGWAATWDGQRWQPKDTAEDSRPRRRAVKA